MVWWLLEALCFLYICSPLATISLPLLYTAETLIKVNNNIFTAKSEEQFQLQPSWTLPT